jgi:urease accessory protein
MMLRATTVVPAGSRPVSPVDTVVLDYDERRRRRIVLRGEGGLEFELDLAETPALSPGDALLLEDGRHVAVAARPERLAEFRFADGEALARVAWQLGNRHAATEFADGALRIRDDHVLVEMVKQLGGAEIGFVEAPFAPASGGAIAGRTHSHSPAHGGHEHSHEHGHDHDHDHDHAEPEVDAELLAAARERRAARKAARAATEHVHGPGCGHDHDHDHAHGHDHGEGCGCGHDHAHEHDHDHAHGHDHGEGCGCGHDHDHDHAHDHRHTAGGCGCGHDHKHG